jgi:hypothetical protein
MFRDPFKYSLSVYEYFNLSEETGWVRDPDGHFHPIESNPDYLWGIHFPAAVLIDMLNDPEHRADAVRKLAVLSSRNTEVIQALLAATRDPDHKLRWFAMYGVVRICALGDLGPVGMQVLQAIVDALLDSCEEIRRLAILALHRISPQYLRHGIPAPHGCKYGHPHIIDSDPPAWRRDYPDAAEILDKMLRIKEGDSTTLLRLRTFYEFACLGSFRRVAAERAKREGVSLNGVPPDHTGPASRVRRLGEELGVPLTRTAGDKRRRTVLTDAGVALAEWLEGCLDSIY